MPAETGTFDQQRLALKEVLSSPEIGRSPNLTRLLVYLCDKYFAGESAGVKEYHIAVEALGRPADFDQKKDAIVRVEMHRLRRRLKEFYERNGQAGSIQITFPEKSYTPRFAGIDPEPSATEVSAARDLAPIPVPESGFLASESAASPSRRKWIVAGLSLAALILISVFVTRWLSPKPTAEARTARPEQDAASSAAPLPAGDEIRILAGRPPGLYVDRYGQTWDGDRYYQGGEAVQTQRPVLAGGFDRNVFLGMRVGQQSYHIPLKPGSYQMELLFAETEYGDGNPLEGGELSRPFRVLVNGKVVLDNLDILAETSDPNVATSHLVTGVTPDKDGKLHLQLEAISTGQPFVNAIIIRPALGDKMAPFRMVCRPQRQRDSKGRLWEADHYFRGGASIVRPTTPPVDDGEIYRGERYGRFSYAIPVAAGAKYQATLYLWESWHGPGRPGAGGAGSRVFSAFCNMTPLFRRYDIIADSGPDQVKIRTFRNLEPDRDSKLVFHFDGELDKALLNALEIVDQSTVH